MFGVSQIDDTALVQAEPTTQPKLPSRRAQREQIMPLTAGWPHPRKIAAQARPTRLRGTAPALAASLVVWFDSMKPGRSMCALAGPGSTVGGWSDGGDERLRPATDPQPTSEASSSYVRRRRKRTSRTVATAPKDVRAMAQRTQTLP